MMVAVQFVASVLGAWFFLYYLPGDDPAPRGAWGVTKAIVLLRYGWHAMRSVKFDYFHCPSLRISRVPCA